MLLVEGCNEDYSERGGTVSRRCMRCDAIAEVSRLLWTVTFRALLKAWKLTPQTWTLISLMVGINEKPKCAMCNESVILPFAQLKGLNRSPLAEVGLLELMQSSPPLAFFLWLHGLHNVMLTSKGFRLIYHFAQILCVRLKWCSANQRYRRFQSSALFCAWASTTTYLLPLFRTWRPVTADLSQTYLCGPNIYIYHSWLIQGSVAIRRLEFVDFNVL